MASRRNCKRSEETLTEQRRYRFVVDEGGAKIAAQHHAADPLHILLRQWLVQSEPLADLVAQHHRLLVAQAALAAGERRGIVGIVAGRRLDQRERHDADGEEEADRRKPASHEEPEHSVSSPDWRAGRTHLPALL